ncbi:hypothetical protein LTR62_007090 [Meristemomyces frigidus]|uniref:DNA helicase n=1 Tax=Meristemomyces frigidus TaxID=1508187 RepID=A0AAN7TB01_9PEZI|nr:hypothetical protein LTR62_007090 [Meristemomyces frigidus]
MNAIASDSVPPDNDAGNDVQQLLVDAQLNTDVIDRTLGSSTAHKPFTNDVAAIKVEDTSSDNAHETDRIETQHSLRLVPALSTRRRESETATDSSSALTSGAEGGRPSKKRKRAPSPPWRLGKVETSTIKTADGRRISARHTGATPNLSESDGPGRSTSQSLAFSRPPSPPWRKFEAEGPTSIQIGGMRKSGRVNKEVVQGSKRTSPRHKKQIDKLEGTVTVQARPVSRGVIAQNDGAGDEIPSQIADRLRSLSPSSRIVELQAQIAKLQPKSTVLPTKPISPSSKPSHKRKQSDDATPRPRGRQPKSVSSICTPQQSEIGARSPTDRRSGIKLKLKSSRPVRPAFIISDPHPQSQSLPSARPPKLSMHQIIEPFELQELQQPYLETEKGLPGPEFFRHRNERLAAEEAEVRRRLLRAAQPNGALSRQACSLFRDEQQEEPPKQYGYIDYLATQALYFRSLQQREKNQHRALAKKVAYEALEQWKTRRGPTEDDIRAEENRIFLLIYKQVVLDVRGKWEMISTHVEQLRKQRWEEEEDARRQERLQKQLDQAQAMVARQRGDEDMSDENMEDDVYGASAESGEDGEDNEDDESAEENMSESGSEDEGVGEEDDGGELTGEALAAYVAACKTDPPDRKSGVEVDPATHEDVSPAHSVAYGISADPAIEDVRKALDDIATAEDPTDFNATHTPRQLHEVHTDHGNNPDNDDHGLSDDESEEMYDSDEDMSSSDQEHDDTEQADDSSEEEDGIQGSSLAALYGPGQLKALGVGLPTPTTSAEGDVRDRTAEPVSDDNDAQAGVTEVLSPEHDSGSTTIMPEATTDMPVAADSTDDVTEPVVNVQSAEDGDSTVTVLKQMVSVPTLLRGKLRTYQHAGLDWLASLHRNGVNGILADEMGLGKTIQTIALLAHLAEDKQIWEPHLIIVPLSVVGNWVQEFHKFLPGFRVLEYHGTQEERLIKRRGWVNDPHHEDREKRGYNVIVTSYDIAMMDINAIRNVQWHYLVLDEAHNIRNFQSQKWQNLIRLKTKARLLLTGTPLQNSLTELWSLLTFLTAGDDDPAHGDLEEFLSHWKEPVKEIFDRGVASLSNEAQKVVDQLHVSLRPFLLRRLKSEVEKDLPKKTESVVVCKLSKRQRELYQEYMGLASTRESLTKGSAVSAGKVLLSLRRVCNHPDLFDPRTIETSFALESSIADSFAIKEALVRKLIGRVSSEPAGLIIVGLEGRRKATLKRSRQLDATIRLRQEAQKLDETLQYPPIDISSIAAFSTLRKVSARRHHLQKLRDGIQATAVSLGQTPVYGADLRELVTTKSSKPYQIKQRRRQPQEASYLMRVWPAVGSRPLQLEHRSDWLLLKDTKLQQDIATVGVRGEMMHDIVARFAFVPPKATAPLLNQVFDIRAQCLLRQSPLYPIETDYAHESRVRTHIAFPDSRLLIYDSGKLQRLTTLLRDLQSRGSRSLIFTQMTFTLDILERFLSLLNLPYLRLDGQTKMKDRQEYATEFNRPDSKYQCMILSSRAGGVGLNLTGASSVIFYDLDWNPQMDRQCMDRAHRIGQVRDVEVYKMVSEKTVEENILRRANQKSLLDQTVIQDGHFTTERQPDRIVEEIEDDGDDVAAALKRVMGGNEQTANQAIASVEDIEDVREAEVARKQERDAAEEFAERSSKGVSAAATPGLNETNAEDSEVGSKGHIDSWMVKIMEESLKDVPFVPPVARRLDKNGRDPSHRPKRKR